MRPLHIFLAICVMAAWGINFVIIKVGLDSFPPILLSALRFALAGLPIVFIWKTPPAPLKWIVAIALSLAIFKFNLLFIGMNLGAGAGLSSLVLQTQAFFTVIFAFFLLDEKPGIRQLLGMGFAFGGLGLIVSERMQEYGAIGGLLFVITAAVCWALANLAMKQAASKNPLHLMIWVSAISAPFLFAISYWLEGGDVMVQALSNINAMGAFSVFYLAFVATLAGFGVWAFLLRTYPAAYVAPFSLLVPIFGMSSAALLLGEEISTLTILAAMLILTGLALNTLKLDFLKRSKTPC
ncbi:EamA family transporter [Terasakiella sp.]|uniref:EamA family transporter n=1 Tax=Terasakiella sp. TaxID=2034861 RepID=UPI003AA7AB88